MCVASAKVVCTERKEPLCILWLSAMRLQISSAFFAQRSNPRSRQTSRMCRWSYLMLFILPSFPAHVALPKVWPKRSSLPSLRWTGLSIRSRHAWVIVEWCGMCGMSSGAARYYDDHSWADIPGAGILQRVCNLKISLDWYWVAAILAYLDFSSDLGFTFVNIWRHLKQEGLSEP